MAAENKEEIKEKQSDNSGDNTSQRKSSTDDHRVKEDVNPSSSTAQSVPPVPQTVFQVPIQGAQSPFQPQSPFPFPLQPQQPQTQTPQIPLSQQINNEDILRNAITEATKEGNSSEQQVPSQIILIASAILSIVGVFALSTDTPTRISMPVGLVLLVSILGLGTSLFTGVLHFTSERKFWYSITQKGSFAQNMIRVMRDPVDKYNAAGEAINQFDRASNRTAFWVQIVSFMIGIAALLLLIVAKIIVRIH